MRQDQGAIVKRTRTTFETGLVLGETTVGAVPRTRYAVSVDGPDPNSGLTTCHVFQASARPPTSATPLSWNSPARFVSGPCNGVPALFGVVERSTTRPGAPGSGPEWNESDCRDARGDRREAEQVARALVAGRRR